MSTQKNLAHLHSQTEIMKELKTAISGVRTSLIKLQGTIDDIDQRWSGEFSNYDKLPINELRQVTAHYQDNIRTVINPPYNIQPELPGMNIDEIHVGGEEVYERGE